MCQMCYKSSMEDAVVTALSEWDIAHWKAFDKRVIKYESDIIKSLRKYFESQLSYFLNEIKKTAKFDNNEYMVTKITASRLKRILDEQNYHDEWDDKLIDTIKPSLIATMASEASYAANLVSGISFELTNDDVERLMGSHLQHIHDINATTRNELIVELQEGYKEGETIHELSNRIMDIFEDADRNRSVMIARTEGVSAAHAGAMQGYIAAGVEYKKWISTKDDRTRGSDPKDEFDHVSMDGEIIPIDQPFNVGGEQMMQPGDDSLGASAGNIINCRCVVAGILAELM